MKNRTPPSNLAFSITVVSLLLVLFYVLTFPFRLFSSLHPLLAKLSTGLLLLIGVIGIAAILLRLTYRLTSKRFIYVFPAIANIGFGMFVFLMPVYNQYSDLSPWMAIICIAIGVFALTDVIVERKRTTLNKSQ